MSTETEAPTESPAKKTVRKKTRHKANGKSKPAKSNRAPRTRNPATLDAWGFRKGSKKSDAALMYQGGATLADVKSKLGSVQFNVLTEIAAKGFKIIQKSVTNDNGREATLYKVTKVKEK